MTATLKNINWVFVAIATLMLLLILPLASRVDAGSNRHSSADQVRAQIEAFQVARGISPGQAGNVQSRNAPARAVMRNL